MQNRWLCTPNRPFPLDPTVGKYPPYRAVSPRGQDCLQWLLVSAPRGESRNKNWNWLYLYIQGNRTGLLRHIATIVFSILARTVIVPVDQRGSPTMLRGSSVCRQGTTWKWPGWTGKDSTVNETNISGIDLVLCEPYFECESNLSFVISSRSTCYV